MQCGPDGVEIKLYDPNRRPVHWTEVLLPTQCAVLLKDVSTSAPLSRACEPLENAGDASCTVFDSIDSAQQFAEDLVAARPNVRCEIFDRDGLTHPPLLVVLPPGQHLPDEPGSFWARRRKVAAAVLFAGALPLIWLDWKGGWSFLPTFFAINMIVAALRLVYWDFGLRQRERERLRRLDAHRRGETAKTSANQ